MKRSKKRYVAVPLTNSSQPSGGGGGRGGGKISFESVGSHQQLCNDITDIEVVGVEGGSVHCLVVLFHSHIPMFQFPVQVARVLNSDPLQHMFSVCAEPSAAIRFTYWLEHSLGYGTYGHVVLEHAALSPYIYLVSLSI